MAQAFNPNAWETGRGVGWGGNMGMGIGWISVSSREFWNSQSFTEKSCLEGKGGEGRGTEEKGDGKGREGDPLQVHLDVWVLIPDIADNLEQPSHHLRVI